MMALLSFVPLMVFVMATVAYAFGRINAKQYPLLMAIGWTINTLASVVQHLTFWSYWSAAFTAWELYRWWKNGGDDDTKRRLRKWKKKFESVRRMAPVTA